MTTESATAAANPDGTVTVSATLMPVRARVNGSWAPIDTTLALGADHAWHPKADSSVAISLSGGGTMPLAVVDKGGQKVTISWPLGLLPMPQITGNNALYPQVLPGVDLRVSADAEGIREVLIVHDAAAAANPALTTVHFGVTGTGVTVTSRDGALVATDNHGRAVFSGPRPAMWDSTDTTPATTAATAPGGDAAAHARHNLADSPGMGAKTATMPVALAGSQATIAPDKHLRTDATVRYPLYIDPQINAAQYHYAQINSCPSMQNTSWLDVNGATGTGNRFMRAGWDAVDSNCGVWRSMFAFNVWDTLENHLPGTTTGLGSSQIGNGLWEDGSNLTNVSLSLWSSSSSSPTQNANFDVDAINRFPGYAPNWTLDGGNSGMWNNPTTLFSSYHMNGSGPGNQMFLGGSSASPTPLFNAVKTAWSNASAFGGTGDGTLTIGLKAGNEGYGVTPYWGFYWTDGDCGCGITDNTTLRISYLPFPFIADTTVTPAPTKSSCGPSSQDPTLRANAGYIRKNIGNQVSIGGHVGDIDSGRTLNISYVFQPEPSGTPVVYQAGTVSPTLGMQHQNPSDLNSPFVPASQSMPGITLSQAGGQLTDNVLYNFHADALDAGMTSLESYVNGNDSYECYFIPAFTNPDAPAVSSQDFPRLGNPSKAGMYATAPSTTGFSISGSTSGVPIDHYDYVINGDSSQIPYNPVGCTTSTPGCASVDAAFNAKIPVPQGATTFGTNTLWIRAVDKATNTSAVTNYSFYLPGNPNATPTLGDVTGDGIPDIVAITPDGHGANHLVVFSGNADPNVLSNVNNAVEAAPASAAPDGQNWANTLIAHRGADRGIPVDDLFAFSTTTKSLYYYLNSSVFGGTVPTDMFSQTHQVLVTRPACTAAPANGNCAGYAPDWSNVTQILALGNAAGGKAGTFAGRTNLITVESDGNHSSHVWMFSASGAGQLTSPVLLSYDVSEFNWANADLIGPGVTTSSGLPDLWVRDRVTGTLYQFTNKKNAQGVEDPTSLGSQTNATVIGAEGQFNATAYPTLVSAGNPTIANGTGVLSQTGAPALWGIQPDGQLKLFPGSASGPITASGSGQNSAWPTSATGWVKNTGATAVNGGAVAASTGPILIGVDQFSGNNLCLDLQSGNTAPGTPVWIYTCNGTAPQVWTIMNDGTIRLGGSASTACLQASTKPAPAQNGLPSTLGNTEGTMNGAPVVIGTCPTAGAAAVPQQQWVLRPSAVAAANFAAGNLGENDWYNIYNPNSGRYLDNPGNATASGTQLQIYDLTDTQAWLNANNPNYRTQEFELPAAAGTWLEALGVGLASQTHEAATAPTTTGAVPGGTAYVLAATKVGDNFGVDWYVPYENDYRVSSWVTTGTGNGVVQVTVDHATSPLPYTCDTYGTYSGEDNPYFGMVHLTAGMHSFTFSVAGKGRSSTGYAIGLDTLFLGPANGVGPNSTIVSNQASSPAAPLPAPASFSFDASQTYAGQATINTYAFDFGDGTTQAAGASPYASHTFAAAGSYTVTTTVTDALGGTSSATTVVYVGAPTPPTPVLAISGNAALGLPIIASATGTTPGSAPITGYSFDFGDGTSPITGTGASATHIYHTAGTYTVQLTETSAAGTATATKTINAATTVPISHVATVASGAAKLTTATTTYTVQASTPSVPGDTLVATIMLAGASAGSITVKDSAGNTYTRIGTPQPDGSGDFAALFAAFNTKPLTGNDTVTATFPAATEQFLAVDDYAGAASIDTTAQATGTTAGFNSGAATAHKTNELLIGAVGSKAGNAATWTSPTAALPDLTVNGDHMSRSWQALTATGNYSATGSGTGRWMALAAILAPPIAPSLAASLTCSPSSGHSPLAVTADASASTAGASPIASYTFDFGDGTSITAQTSPTLAHTYSAIGSYTAKLTVTDSTGATSSTTTPVIVTGPPAIGYIGRVGVFDQEDNGTYTSSAIAAGPNGVPAGHTLAISAVLDSDISAGIPAVTDTEGNTYRLDVNQNDGYNQTALLFTGTITKPLTSTDMITVSYPAAYNQLVTVDEYTGVTAVDQVASSAGATWSGPFNSTNAAPTSSADELILAASGSFPSPELGAPNDPPAFATNSGFAPQAVIGTNVYLLTGYKTVTATGSYHATGSTPGFWMTGVVTLTGATRHALPSLSDSSWTGNGTTAVSGTGPASSAILTADGTANTASSLVNATPINPIGLSASFGATISGAASTGAYGMTFALLDATKSDKNALGTNGPGLGIEGQTGVFFSLNTLDTTGVSGTNWCGIATTTSSSQSYLSFSSAIPTLRNTGQHTIGLTVTSASHIVVTIDGAQTLDQAVTLPPSVLIAFTASTGTSTDTHTVTSTNITYQS